MNAPLRASDFVGELCVALAHRWYPERLFVLIYTGYLDESGTHDGSVVTVMGGIMAHSRQWSEFAKEFTRLKKKHGFKIFHTKKFKKKRGDFSGWSNEQCLALLYDLAAVTNNAFTEGVSMALENETYQHDYKAGEKPKKLRLDSKYGLCFRQCLFIFVFEAIKRKHRKKYPKLHIVLESGDPNIGDALRIFEEVKKELEKDECDILQTITVADKNKCDPLMMADFIAHSTYTIEGKVMAGQPPRPTPPVGRKQSAVTHLRFKPGGLADIKKQLIAKLSRKVR